MGPPRRLPARGCLPSRLKDPCRDRSVPSVPAPPTELLTGDIFYDSTGTPDILPIIEHLFLEGLLCQELLLEIVAKAGAIFENEPNLLKLADPITVVGDLHGQYYDFIKLLEVGGKPGDTQYVFLGDYVDRGSFSVEVVVLLYALKMKYPKRVWMLRGNHECRQMTSFFNFREECEYKYDISVYNAIMASFDNLPIAATVNGKFLLVHGGLSPSLIHLKTITSIQRFQEPPKEGVICDLLWADPYEPKEGEPQQRAHGRNAPAFIPNETRGCSYFFTHEGSNKFLQKNGLLSVIRAHEAQVEGYKMHKTNPATGFPSVITIFSAPNYCDCYNNKAAILKFDNSTLNILQFVCSPHPYHLPNFMDVFGWSMPFVIEKVMGMLFFVLKGLVDEDDTVTDDIKAIEVQDMLRSSLSAEQNEAILLASRLAEKSANPDRYSDGAAKAGKRSSISLARAQELRKKVQSVGRMARLFKTLREENESIIALKGVCPGHKLSPGTLLAGKEKLESELEVFGFSKAVDKMNERRPDHAQSLPEPDEEDPEGEATLASVQAQRSRRKRGGPAPQ